MSSTPKINRKFSNQKQLQNDRKSVKSKKSNYMKEQLTKSRSWSESGSHQCWPEFTIAGASCKSSGGDGKRKSWAENCDLMEFDEIGKFHK